MAEKYREQMLKKAEAEAAEASGDEEGYSDEVEFSATDDD
jgi:hypothetical protein